MTTRQPPPPHRANAEAILAGTATERSELTQIIAAARGSATSAELAGEAAAMIRFQGARLEPAAAHGVTVRKRMSDKLLAAKVGIAAALAAAATGGVALAAAAHTQTEPAHHAPGGAGSHPSASPSRSLRGLCIAYFANEITGGKRMDNPAFGALVTAAGGKDKITTYCLTLLRADPHPTRPARSYSI